MTRRPAKALRHRQSQVCRTTEMTGIVTWPLTACDSREKNVVYLIERDDGVKRYIGQTARTLRHRIANHLWDVNVGSRFRLHYAIRKYGAMRFRVSILERCSTSDELNAAEIRRIKESRPEYNATFGGQGRKPPRKPMSAETRAKLSQRCLERHRRGVYANQRGRRLDPGIHQRLVEAAARAHNKPVICLDTGETWESATAAGRGFGVPDTTISRCCREHRPMNGLRFRFLQEAPV